MDNLAFSSGRMFIRDTSVTPNVPMEFAELADVSVSWEQETKPYYGGKKWAITTAGGKNKASIKAKHARFSSAALARMKGGTTATGVTRVLTESPTKTSNTQTVTNTTGWADLGVRDASGNPMTPVASAPTIGQYSCSAGVYTYNASEPGTPSITYSYTVAATGTTTTVTNSAISGAMPTFEVVVYTEYTDESGAVHKYGIKFFAVVFSKLDSSLKVEDFGEESLEGQVQARASDGKVFEEYRG